MNKLMIAVAAALLSGNLGAQTFKCTDAAGKITYSGTKCSDLRMKDAGAVKDRVQVTPAYRPAAQTTGASRPSAPAAASKAQDTETPVGAAKPAEPERRCFTVKTGKGTATRCDDKPQE